MSENTEKFKELNESFASLESAAKELKACMDTAQVGKSMSDPMHDKLNNFAQAMYASINHLRQTMYNLHDSHAKRINDNHNNIHDRMDKHMEGHIPAIKSVEQMNGAIKALGLDKEYEAPKRQVVNMAGSSYAYASTIKASKKGLSVEIDFSKPKEENKNNKV